MGAKLYLQPWKDIVGDADEGDRCPTLRSCLYFKRSHQEVANKMSAVKFYRPVKCNLIKAGKCRPYWLLVQHHSDSQMMEEAINSVINEPNSVPL